MEKQTSKSSIKSLIMPSKDELKLEKDGKESEEFIPFVRDQSLNYNIKHSKLKEDDSLLKNTKSQNRINHQNIQTKTSSTSLSKRPTKIKTTTIANPSQSTPPIKSLISLQLSNHSSTKPHHSKDNNIQKIISANTTTMIKTKIAMPKANKSIPSTSLSTTSKSSITPLNKKYHPSTFPASLHQISKKYHDHESINNLVVDSVKNFGRDKKAAGLWIAQLNRQEIYTVGDLRSLYEDDWYHLGLSVLAIRAIKDTLNNSIHYRA